MTSPNDTTAEQVHCHGFGRDANWSGWNIAALVLGFVIFWPIGLFFLYWILKGRDVREIPGKLSGKWSGNSTRKWFGREDSGSNNEVFDAYQQTQYDRIREIRDEIRDRARRFSEFRQAAKRRADEDEFKRFMDDSPRPDDKA